MTSDSKAHKCFPQIDDEMIARACFAVGVSYSKFCAALDRRVGPKCRRVEWNDVDSPDRRLRLGHKEYGRRNTDTTSPTTLSTKSSRLAREAAEKEEIPVSDLMRQAGASALDSFHWQEPANRADTTYRVMERVRREEQKGLQGAPYGASFRPIAECHRRAGDGPVGAGSIWRAHRRAGDPK